LQVSNLQFLGMGSKIPNPVVRNISKACFILEKINI
jgi:hypothetical protein